MQMFWKNDDKLRDVSPQKLAGVIDVLKSMYIDIRTDQDFFVITSSPFFTVLLSDPNERTDGKNVE